VSDGPLGVYEAESFEALRHLLIRKLDIFTPQGCHGIQKWSIEDGIVEL
jgi:hypothetical protein